MRYLLDTNVFITAKNIHYGFDFCPAFWDWLALKNSEGKIFSIQQVARELKESSDELWKWSKERGAAFFLEPDESVLAALAEVGSKVNDGDYKIAATQKFMESADHFLIAHALAHSCSIVTHEVRKTGSKNAIKIPDICDELKIRCMMPHEMLRVEGACFVLAGGGADDCPG